MMQLEVQFADDQALHACETCKRRKRKCDKALPKCSFCTRKHLQCDYTDAVQKPQSGRSQNSEPNQLAQSRIPSVFFLDHDIFQQRQMDIPIPSLSIPAYILDLVGDNTSIRNIATEYFSTVHGYLPIVSKRSFYDLLLNPLVQRRADVAFLGLCMKLVLWTPSDQDGEPQTAEYLAAKLYLSELENAGVFTVTMLQAKLLVSLYEIGQGIYPAAYTSIGACAAQGVALGLGSGAKDESGRTFTALEEEERRRIWWGILILERMVYLGSTGRPLVTPDPTAHDLLPSEDISWDEGFTTLNYPIESPVGAPANMGRFARLAHATYLLSRVIRHINFNFTDAKVREEEIIQLDRTIHALMVVCELEAKRTGLRFCNPLAFASSALLLLHSHYLAPEPPATAVAGRYYREESWTAIKTQSQYLAAGYDISLRTNAIWLPIVSPMVLHSTYYAGVYLVRMNRESSSQETEAAVQTVKRALAFKDGRWKVAGAYLRILEAREIMNTY